MLTIMVYEKRFWPSGIQPARCRAAAKSIMVLLNGLQRLNAQLLTPGEQCMLSTAQSIC